LFEPPCAACRAPLHRPLDGAVCDGCWASIRISRLFDERLDVSHPISWRAAVNAYEGRMTDIIHALKYDRRQSIAPRLGALMRKAGAAMLADADCVVPVPLHPWREFRRGFNQAHQLALHLGPPIAPLLKRVRNTTPQIDLPREQRLANVTDAFTLAAPGSRFPVPGVVVLIDDVATTGATLESCAQVLLRSGVKEVRALTAARVVNAPR
jgi:ComF family protein